MKKKKTALLVALLVFSVAALGGLVAVVYAKYIASLSVTGTGTIAKWAFASDNQGGTATCTITSSPASGTVAANKIAPGTSGTCTLDLENTNSDVAVDYTVTANTGSSTNIPANMILNGGSLNNFSATGTLAIGGSTTITINWSWPYETGSTTAEIADEDDEDTDDGEAAATSATMTLAFDVKGVQHNPANAIAP